MNIKGISAPEYLDAARRARIHGAEKPGFRRLVEGLRTSREARDRLAIEFLTMAWRELEQGSAPDQPVILGVRFGEPIGKAKRSEYLSLLERIIFRSFELFRGVKGALTGRPVLYFTLRLELTALRRADESRFRAILAAFRMQMSANDDGCIRDLLAEVDEPQELQAKRSRRLIKEIKLREAQNERRLRSFGN
jgi:hypothetical protein